MLFRSGRFADRQEGRASERFEGRADDRPGKNRRFNRPEAPRPFERQPGQRDGGNWRNDRGDRDSWQPRADRFDRAERNDRFERDDRRPARFERADRADRRSEGRFENRDSQCPACRFEGRANAFERPRPTFGNGGAPLRRWGAKAERPAALVEENRAAPRPYTPRD